MKSDQALWVAKDLEGLNSTSDRVNFEKSLRYTLLELACIKFLAILTLSYFFGLYRSQLGSQSLVYVLIEDHRLVAHHSDSVHIGSLKGFAQSLSRGFQNVSVKLRRLI